MKTYEKKSYPLTQVRQLLEPGPIVLVSSRWKGEDNIMVMGWHMMLGFSPALFGCYIWEGNHSFEMIRRSRQCVINLPTADMVDTVVAIGNSSGAERINKFETFALTPGRAQMVDTPLITECYANFECKLAEAPSQDYRVWPGKGIRVRDRVFTCPELSVHRGSTKRVVVRMEPLDRSICYVQVGDRWLVCHDGTASVSQGIPDIEVAASALEGEELRSVLRRAYLDAEVTMHELKLSRLPTELHETTARLAKPKPSTPPAAASALTRPKNLEEVPLLPVRPEQQP